jgi:hypothetical protein
MSENKINIVECIADPDECSFDQPCIFGHHVKHHAVYCHNPEPGYPRKCKYFSWGYEDLGECPGFKANPNYKETL